MGRKDGGGFQMLLRPEDVLLLSIWTWRGARQICKQTKVSNLILTSEPAFCFCHTAIMLKKKLNLYLMIKDLSNNVHTDQLYTSGNQSSPEVSEHSSESTCRASKTSKSDFFTWIRLLMVPS